MSVLAPASTSRPEALLRTTTASQRAESTPPAAKEPAKEPTGTRILSEAILAPARKNSNCTNKSTTNSNSHK